MQFITASVLCLLFFSYSVSGAAPNCDASAVCAGSDCRCSSTNSPLAEEDGETPQLIALTFDESVVDDVFTNLWQPLLFDRENPDGNPITATFFVPHEYTDYKRVQDLWVRGFEIGVNSITKNSLASYWTSANVSTLVDEFSGQRIIISTFANIPIEDIVGARTPQLQLEGDVSINAYIQSELQYDSSWTSRSTSMYFPYTLDYLSTQECRIGTTCPTDSHPGFWIAPIIDLQGNSTDPNTPLECNALNACNFQGTASEITDWLLQQVDRERTSERAPLQLLVPSAWFRIVENSYDAFSNFLDVVLDYGDTYFVSVKEIIDWAKNPVSLDDFQTQVFEGREIDCLNITCPLYNDDNNLRYMRSCIPCPMLYPWLGNPLGQP